MTDEAGRFKAGDLVRHRASGEIAVVTYVDDEEGKVDLSLGLNMGMIRPLTVRQFLLEHVHEKQAADPYSVPPAAAS